jgi:hypothetical protein
MPAPASDQVIQVIAGVMISTAVYIAMMILMYVIAVLGRLMLTGNAGCLKSTRLGVRLPRRLRRFCPTGQAREGPAGALLRTCPISGWDMGVPAGL